MLPPIITLTTDFGAGSRYVGAMKGVIYSIAPMARVVDLTHSIAPQDVRGGAIALEETTPWFPPETIHVAVIDPGVGSGRSILYARIGVQQFIAPDNGLLSRLAEREKPSKIIHITEPRFWLPRVSSTFHGRDIMAPIASRLSLGLPPEQLGPAAAGLTELYWSEARRMANHIDGEVIEIDSFGNLITNISREMLRGVPTDESVTVTCDDHQTQGIFSTYSDQPALTLVALISSGDRLELAIVDESAAAMLGVNVGAAVRVSW